MTPEEQTRALVEALHDLSTEQERLFALIAALGNLLDRDVVVETVAQLLGTKPVDQGNLVRFGDIAIQFGSDNRVTSMYRTIDGENPAGDIAIGEVRSDRDSS